MVDGQRQSVDGNASEVGAGTRPTGIARGILVKLDFGGAELVLTDVPTYTDMPMVITFIDTLDGQPFAEVVGTFKERDDGGFYIDSPHYEYDEEDSGQPQLQPPMRPGF